MNRISTLSILLVCLGASYTAALPVGADKAEASFLCADPKSSSGLLDLLDPMGGALQKTLCGIPPA